MFTVFTAAPGVAMLAKALAGFRRFAIKYDGLIFDPQDKSFIIICFHFFLILEKFYNREPGPMWRGSR